jgi:hypothetical protein
LGLNRSEVSYKINAKERGSKEVGEKGQSMRLGRLPRSG